MRLAQGPSPIHTISQEAKKRKNDYDISLGGFMLSLSNIYSTFDNVLYCLGRQAHPKQDSKNQHVIQSAHPIKPNKNSTNYNYSTSVVWVKQFP